MTDSAREPEINVPLSAAQTERLRARSQAQEVDVGAELFRAGDATYDFIYVESGLVDIVRPATPDAPEEVIATHGAGRFLGELSLLTGQRAYLTARVRERGRVHRISGLGFRRLMAEDRELADIILKTLLARRRRLQAGEGARSMEILGAALSPAAHSLRNWAARQQVPHVWLDIDSPEGQVLGAALDVVTDDLPVVVTSRATLRRATPATVAEEVGLTYQPITGHEYDVVVVGAGPGGLAAAVYGASEGLDTLLLEAEAVGGQAAASSLIENYLGFPFGLSGALLTSRAELQAQKFGARVSVPCRVTRLRTDGGHLVLVLGDGTEITTHAVVIATGASYRTLDLERWDDFVGAGIYYAATQLEVRTCAPDPVTVVGGANSAGQAALFLAGSGCPVNLVVRGPDIAASMSQYLVDRIYADDRITVRTGARVTALHGDDSLAAVDVHTSDETSTCDCRGLFCFIGARPATDWLEGVALDEDGFVLTDNQLGDEQLNASWRLLGRRPLPFETSMPGVFAVGDVRQGSMKRVAAAVGEGASAIRSVHAVITPRA